VEKLSDPKIKEHLLGPDTKVIIIINMLITLIRHLINIRIRNGKPSFTNFRFYKLPRSIYTNILDLIPVAVVRIIDILYAKYIQIQLYAAASSMMQLVNGRC
jgi:hypothetical protein